MQRFVELQWNQRTGGNYREPFRPVLAQPQPDAFDGEQYGIAQRDQADGDELARPEILQHADQSPAQPVAVGQGEMLQPMHQVIFLMDGLFDGLERRIKCSRHRVP